MTTTTTLLAWHGNPEIKAEVVARMKAHREADSIIQGCYQYIDTSLALGYEGCALGCTLPRLPHDEAKALDAAMDGRRWWGRIETEYGIPVSVARLIDDTFEMQDGFTACAQFAVAVVEAIPVGADLGDVFQAWRDAWIFRDEPAEQACWLIGQLAAAPIPEATRC